ncbi:ankyrin [Hysterangium stoloniferum]|nr:ankyrin [Hysterangium stoloniferum]
MPASTNNLNNNRSSQKNIWVAAGEGDLDRVKVRTLSPNVPDPYTYTPMHAAASYGQIEVLDYLVGRGGDVNVKDNDNETPLFTVESVEVARWLINHGADITVQNADGMTPAQHLAEEFPGISSYLHSLDSLLPAPTASLPQPSNYTTDQAASSITQSILTNAQEIMQRADAEGRDPEEELREMVGRAVLGGVVTGAGWAQDEMGVTHEEDRTEPGDGGQPETKRRRFEDAGR